MLLKSSTHSGDCKQGLVFMLFLKKWDSEVVLQAGSEVASSEVAGSEVVL
jgi:hypothetical protein